MLLTDRTLYCRDCNQEFTFTVGEQEFYASRGLTNDAGRCPECRTARKQSGNGRNGGFREREPRQMYTATCSKIIKAEVNTLQMCMHEQRSITMSSKAFEAGDRVRIMENGFGRGSATLDGTIGIVRSVDKGRRRTEPYYIYYVELPGDDTPLDFEYRELEFVSPVSD